MAVKRFVPLALLGSALCVAAWTPLVGSEKSPFRTLIVGGGPNPEHNQVAIESNVRYVERLMSPSAARRVLFADGNADSKNIECQDGTAKPFFKKSDIDHIDGPSNLDAIGSELSAIVADAAKSPRAPVMLYFTGHGSPDGRSQFANNSFDLWNDKHLSVKTLAGYLAGFPKSTPITLVMVQCFSGAFGNLLFQDGDASGELADLNICGFFASVAQRPAAGCTPELKEANYRDFTGYFFAAMTGVDRMGNKVSGADYNHDGKVGMNEAFAYTLIHDESIDTPVCTSDVFLRRFIKTPDKDVVATSYRDIESWASPSQLAALTALSSELKLTDDNRLQVAYDAFMKLPVDSDAIHDVKTIRFVRLGKSVVLAHELLTTGDRETIKRYQALIKAESGNPLR